jgi:hypothetical protein
MSILIFVSPENEYLDSFFLTESISLINLRHEIPDAFQQMFFSLEKNFYFNKYKYKNDYLYHNYYDFYHGGIKLNEYMEFIFDDNASENIEHFPMTRYPKMFFQPTEKIVITVVPLRCCVCINNKNSYIRKFYKDNSIVHQCEECIKRKNKQDNQPMYIGFSSWNTYKCTTCEKYGNKCKDCRGI